MLTYHKSQIYISTYQHINMATCQHITIFSKTNLIRACCLFLKQNICFLHGRIVPQTMELFLKRVILFPTLVSHTEDWFPSSCGPVHAAKMVRSTFLCVSNFVAKRSLQFGKIVAADLAAFPIANLYALGQLNTFKYTNESGSFVENIETVVGHFSRHCGCLL